MPKGNDQAGQDYWNSLWADTELPSPVDPADTHFGNYVNRVLAQCFDRVMSCLPQGARVLEVGCAHSVWLPYFGQQYPVTVAGLDYSEPGCATERAILRRACVDGEVIQADLFDPPEHTLEAFDAVFSMGVAEHFTDTASCLKAISRFAKPGGIVVTTIPNMAGVVGQVQRLVNPTVFGMHVPLTAPALAEAHEQAGLDVESSGYLLSTNFGVISLHGLPESRRSRWIAKAVLQLTRISKLVWILEDRTRSLPARRTFAPYAVCFARR